MLNSWIIARKTLSILTPTITSLHILETELQSRGIVKEIYNRKWVMLNSFFSHRFYLINNTESVIYNVFRPQRVPHRHNCLSGTAELKTSMSEDFYIRPSISYVTWDPRSHREARLNENSDKRIIVSCCASVVSQAGYGGARTSNKYKTLFWKYRTVQCYNEN